MDFRNVKLNLVEKIAFDYHVGFCNGEIGAGSVRGRASPWLSKRPYALDGVVVERVGLVGRKHCSIIKFAIRSRILVAEPQNIRSAVWPMSKARREAQEAHLLRDISCKKGNYDAKGNPDRPRRIADCCVDSADGRSRRAPPRT